MKSIYLRGKRSYNICLNRNSKFNIGSKEKLSAIHGTIYHIGRKRKYMSVKDKCSILKEESKIVVLTCVVTQNCPLTEFERNKSKL